MRWGIGIMGEDIRRILIARTDRIGEVLLSTVAVDAVKKTYPEAEITFLTSSYAAPLVRNRNDIREIWIFETIGKRKWLFESVQLALKLRRGHFDEVFILNPHKALHLAVFLAGIPARTGYSRKWGFLLNNTIPDKRDEGIKHETEYTMDLLAASGIHRDKYRPVLSPNEKSIRTVKEYLKSNNIGEDIPFIVMHPCASNPAKMWPENNYSELISGIKERLDCNIALVGDGGSCSTIKRIIDGSSGDAMNCSGLFDLDELTALINRSDILIGNDSGPMHMAAALNVPVVALFGRNIPGVGPIRWGPAGEGNIVIYTSDNCRECADSLCEKDFKCLKAIKPVDVIDAAVHLLKNSGKG